MATRLNNMPRPRPVGNAVRYVRAGARLLRRTVTKKGRRVEIRFTAGVAQPQPRVQIQTDRVSQLNHQSGAENNHTNHVASSPFMLSTNDSATSIGTSSSRDSTFDYREYEVDLVLSVALIGDKEQYTHDQAEDAATTELEPEPVQVDSTDRNNERSNSGSSTSVAASIYNSLKSTKAKIDNFVKWYRRELERRNLI